MVSHSAFKEDCVLRRPNLSTKENVPNQNLHQKSLTDTTRECGTLEERSLSREMAEKTGIQRDTNTDKHTERYKNPNRGSPPGWRHVYTSTYEQARKYTLDRRRLRLTTSSDTARVQKS